MPGYGVRLQLRRAHLKCTYGVQLTCQRPARQATKNRQLSVPWLLLASPPTDGHKVQPTTHSIPQDCFSPGRLSCTMQNTEYTTGRGEEGGRADKGRKGVQRSPGTWPWLGTGLVRLLGEVTEAKRSEAKPREAKGSKAASRPWDVENEVERKAHATKKTQQQVLLTVPVLTAEMERPRRRGLERNSWE